MDYVSELRWYFPPALVVISAGKRIAGRGNLSFQLWCQGSFTFLFYPAKEQYYITWIWCDEFLIFSAMVTVPTTLHCNHVFQTTYFRFVRCSRCSKYKTPFSVHQRTFPRKDCEDCTFRLVHGGLCVGEVTCLSGFFFFSVPSLGALATRCELYCSKVAGEELRH